MVRAGVCFLGGEHGQTGEPDTGPREPDREHGRISRRTALRTRTRRPRLNGAPRHGPDGWRFASLLHAIRTRVGVSELQDASPRPSGGLTTVPICGMCNFAV